MKNDNHDDWKIVITFQNLTYVKLLSLSYESTHIIINLLEF